MASNFAFQAFGLSQQVTVGGANPVTVSLSVLNGTVTAALANGNYQPSGVRIVNEGTASVFLNFFATTGATVTVSAANGMRMLANAQQIFSVRGQPVIAAVCASTFTVTLCVTPGEGM